MTYILLLFNEYNSLISIVKFPEKKIMELTKRRVRYIAPSSNLSVRVPERVAKQSMIILLRDNNVNTKFDSLSDNVSYHGGANVNIFVTILSRLVQCFKKI